MPLFRGFDRRRKNEKARVARAFSRKVVKRLHRAGCGLWAVQTGDGLIWFCEVGRYSVAASLDLRLLSVRAARSFREPLQLSCP